MTQRCSTCKFIDGLYCRRYPPTVVDSVSISPKVLGESWCGEYQPNVEIRREIEDETFRYLMDIPF